jgi:hypothetical protein
VKWRAWFKAELHLRLLAAGLARPIADAVTSCAAELSTALHVAVAGDRTIGSTVVVAVVDSFGPVANEHPYLDFRVWSRVLASVLPSLNVEHLGEHSDASVAAGNQALRAPIPYSGLQRARGFIGHVGILDLFESGARIARLKPHDARYALYTSQSFFDREKAVRAVSGHGLDQPLPARIRVRDEDGFINFVLADGHHRALVLNGRDRPIHLLPHPKSDVRQHYSFRNFVREHWAKL